MILTKTPIRISFLGGGTEYLSWCQDNVGMVLGCTIQQYSYLGIRKLPEFFDYKTRLSYSKIETVESNDDIEHKVIREAIKYFNIKDGLEISHMADVPSKSGLGTSSSFLVGLVNGLGKLCDLGLSKKDLYNYATDIEQNHLKESVGLQDSAWAAFGGIGAIEFRGRDDVTYKQFQMTTEELKEFESHVMLFYTKMPRTSSDVASKYVPSLKDKEHEMMFLVELVRQGMECFKRKDYIQLGRLLRENWNLKKSLHKDISNTYLDYLNKLVEDCGGYSKISGAGGGGSLLVITEPPNRTKIKEALKDVVELPVKIDLYGSRILQCV